MCVNLSNMKSKVSVSYNVKLNGNNLNSENILSMFSGGLANDLNFNVVSEKDIVQVNYYSDKFFLLSDYLKKRNNCNAKFYVKEFCKFILNAEHYLFLLGLDQIFCDENGLYFIPSLFDNNDVSEPVQKVKSFLNSITDISEECFSDIKEICTFAQGNGVTVSDIIAYIDICKNISEEVETVEVVRQCPECGMVYEDKYIFCIKCGCKLQEIKKESEANCQETDEKTFSEESAPESNDNTETIENLHSEKKGVKRIRNLRVKGLKYNVQKKAEKNSEQNVENSETAEDKNKPSVDEEIVCEMPEQISSDAVKSKYGETTLLGFTNYGETAVLNGMSNNFDMPNLIRKSTDEKIYISKRIFVIGKSADKADYTVNNSAVSRVHAEISVVGSEYYITDKGSTNHTYVNHSEILSNSPQQIFDGDEIMFANEVFTFHFQ